MHFASKALPCAPVTRILAEEGLGCDVASAGELAIALAAGFDPAHILLHGNAKSDRDIGDALAAGVGVIVIDGPDDVDRLDRLATAPQNVLLRVNPAVPGVTHAAMDTGSPEAKFGVAIEDLGSRWKVDDTFWACHNPARGPDVRVTSRAECEHCAFWQVGPRERPQPEIW